MPMLAGCFAYTPMFVSCIQYNPMLARCIQHKRMLERCIRYKPIFARCITATSVQTSIEHVSANNGNIKISIIYTNNNLYNLSNFLVDYLPRVTIRTLQQQHNPLEMENIIIHTVFCHLQWSIAYYNIFWWLIFTLYFYWHRWDMGFCNTVNNLYAR
jgi:hypothetical protein